MCSAAQIPARLARPPWERRRRLSQALIFVGFSETQYKQGFQQLKLAIFPGMPAFHFFGEPIFILSSAIPEFLELH